MIKAIIIEDENLARLNLKAMLEKSVIGVQVVAMLSSVKEGISYFSQAVTADLIFSDIQLTDGLSFEIFNKTGINLPVIFTTGYDKYMIEAMEYNGIDYLLKPVEIESLDKSLSKYTTLQNHFLNNPLAVQKLSGFINEKKKSRIVVKKGTVNVVVKFEEIAAFYTENRLVYAVDKTGKKFLTDKNLGELEEELDLSVFYRVNRQYIININFIKGYRSFERVKLKVELALPETNHNTIISQEVAPYFRKWISAN